MENTNKDFIKENQVEVAGVIVSKFGYSHEVFGEGFYLVDVSVKRLSGAEDIIPVMVSERMVDVKKNCMGEFVRVYGQFRSYNKSDGQKSRLFLSVFARDFKFLTEEPGKSHDNSITLEGYICKPPVYRETPLGREITDILIAVNRPHGKSDYIPVIAWGRNAGFAYFMEVGDRISIKGRIQSRDYKKNYGDHVEERRAYEVSVQNINLVV